MKKQMILAIALALAAALQAAPAQFTYQGVLKDASDTPLTGPHQVKLRLYDVPDGSNAALWGRTYAVLLDANGLFNTEVSDVTGTAISGEQYDPLDTVFATTNTLYIGLTVDGSSGEITPRQKLLPVPFAAVAANVSRASGNFTVAGRLTAQSAEFTGDLTATNISVSMSVAAKSLTVTNATVQGSLNVTGTIAGFGTVPIRGIIMWGGFINDIPQGWHLCDGGTYNGIKTPDLRDRFIVGAGSSNYSVGSTGGEPTVGLRVEDLPSHAHNYTFKVASLAGTYKPGTADFYTVLSSGEHSVTKTTASVGSNWKHENRPPYYALCFIMRIQ